MCIAVDITVELPCVLLCRRATPQQEKPTGRFQPGSQPHILAELNRK